MNTKHFHTSALTLALFFLFSACGNDRADRGQEQKQEQEKEQEQKAEDIFPDTTGYSLKVLESLHQRLNLKSRDASLTDYVKSKPNRVDSVHKTIYILPFGNMKPDVKKIVEEELNYLRAFFQLKVVLLDSYSYDSVRVARITTRMVPDGDYTYYSKKKGGRTQNLREQIQATSFMDVAMKAHIPDDAVAVLGITEHDIYDPGYNFLFATSGLRSRVGIVSTFRMIDYGPQTKYNIRKLMSKQIANMFSIPNVQDFRCVMNFDDTYEKFVAGPFTISPVALSKLKYATGFDYEKRFLDLESIWKKEKNEEELKYCQECLKIIATSEEVKSSQKK